MPESENRERYLILIGAPKSGTTSLFRYLSEHPGVCAANRKETYFFAREFDYTGVCKLDLTRPAFETYFSHCPDGARLRLEGTPYTLYTRGAAATIAGLLPEARLLALLREPVGRLFSDYRFHQERSHPAAAGTFAEFVERQRTMNTGGRPNLLELGCYADFLRPFIEQFGRARVEVQFFEELTRDPAGEMGRLCTRLGLDPGFFATYDFETHNQTVNVRYGWLHRLYVGLEPAVAGLRAAVMRRPGLHRWFENTLTSGKALYRSLNNRQEAARETIPPALQAELTEFYRPSVAALAALLGRAIPWKAYQE